MKTLTALVATLLLTAASINSHAAAMAEHGLVAFAADYRVKDRNKTTPFECVKDALTRRGHEAPSPIRT